MSEVYERVHAMSAAAELRTAADKLRELAEGATPGPWGWKPANPNKLGPLHDASLTGPSCGLTSGADIWIRDAVYIAAMNPLVGLALADLLDSLADDAEQSIDDRAAYGAPPRDETVLARLINGGAP